MTHSKITIINGFDSKFPNNFSEMTIQQRHEWIENHPIKSTKRRGFLKKETIRKVIKKMQLVQSIKAIYIDLDTSGRGRDTEKYVDLLTE